MLLSNPPRFLTPILVWIGSAIGSGSVALAKLAPITLVDLIATSDQIVVGRVVEVHRVGGHRVARVEVLSSHKGTPTAHVYYVADRTWACDVSDAIKGETSLLFLNRSEDLERDQAFRQRLARVAPDAVPMLLAAAGRGRMPIQSLEDRDLATVWTGAVWLAFSIQTSDGSAPEAEPIRTVKLDDMLSLIDTHVRADEGK